MRGKKPSKNVVDRRKEQPPIVDMLPGIGNDTWRLGIPLPDPAAPTSESTGVSRQVTGEPTEAQAHLQMRKEQYWKDRAPANAPYPYQAVNTAPVLVPSGIPAPPPTPRQQLDIDMASLWKTK